MGNRRYPKRIPRRKKVLIIGTIGSKIRGMRLARNMTQDKLGALLGIGPEDVEEMETAESLNLDSHAIRTLCETFNAFPSLFIYESDRQFWEDAMKIGEQDIEGYVSTFLNNPMAPFVLSQELGESGFGVLNMLTEINHEGVDRTREYVADLIRIDEYRK